MKIWVILFFILLLPSVYAIDVSITDLFEVESQENIGNSVKEVYYYAGSKLILVNDEYQYQNRLGSDFESKTLPFGESIKEENRLSFTGKELDSELYYFNARYYNPELGRFNSVDPVKENHPYSYVNNNPLNFVDPTGMDYTGEAGDISAQLNYFDNTLTEHFKEGEIGKREISAIRGLLEAGDMLIVPGNLDAQHGVYFPEGKRMVYHNSYDYINEETGEKIYSTSYYSSTNMARGGDFGSYKNMQSKPIREARILIRGNALMDAYIAAAILHEYQHTVNARRGITNRVEDEYIAFRRQANFLKKTVGHIPLDTDLAHIARRYSIEDFYEASKPNYHWEDKGVKLTAELKDKYPGPGKLKGWWMDRFD